MSASRVAAIVCAVVITYGGWGASAAGPVTLDSLLDEMTDLSMLAEYPDPPFTCKQFSSYDRRSKTPEDHEGWFANGDRGKYIRVEERAGRKEFVMLDAEGPGCVVRIWSANAGGDLRIYLDGNDKPALEMNMQHAMDGRHEPFLAPLAGVHSRGWNLYFPFPYARHCKVTTTDGNIYYHVNYRTYPKSAKVESFSMRQIRQRAREGGKIERIRRLLAKPYVSNLPPEGAATKKIKLTSIAPGASKTIAELKGPAAIFEFEGRLNVDNWRQMLRHTVLEIAFDDRKPSVVCPIGDFFGSSPDINPFESLPLQIHASSDLRSKWLMPFRKSCTITLINKGKSTVAFIGDVRTVPYRWTDRSMYFHAKWRAENRMKTRPFHDWTFVETKGKGVFVGCVLNVANPVKQWWGEGDEKIYVDGETFPSHFGTGTEDYFGYAWCCNIPFVHAYHNQPRCDGPGNYGLTSVNRFHIIDQIPFTKQFQFDIEVWHWHQTTRVSYNATSYWYARPGGSDFYKPLTREMLEVIEPPPAPQPRKVKGAIEGESLKIVRRSGAPEVQEGFEDLWSGGKQIWWKGAKPEDILIVAFPAREAGRYKVIGNFTTAADYGIIQIYINGEKAGNPMDFYIPQGVKVTGNRELGTFDLKKGNNELKAVILGKNTKAIPNYMFGIDYLLLEKAK